MYNGAIIPYNNLNGDRTITQDELTGPPAYFGGLNGPIFDLQSFVNTQRNRFRFQEFQFLGISGWIRTTADAGYFSKRDVHTSRLS